MRVSSVTCTFLFVTLCTYVERAAAAQRERMRARAESRFMCSRTDVLQYSTIVEACARDGVWRASGRCDGPQGRLAPSHPEGRQARMSTGIRMTLAPGD